MTLSLRIKVPVIYSAYPWEIKVDGIPAELFMLYSPKFKTHFPLTTVKDGSVDLNRYNGNLIVYCLLWYIPTRKWAEPFVISHSLIGRATHLAALKTRTLDDW